MRFRCRILLNTQFLNIYKVFIVKPSLHTHPKIEDRLFLGDCVLFLYICTIYYQTHQYHQSRKHKHSSTYIRTYTRNITHEGFYRKTIYYINRTLLHIIHIWNALRCTIRCICVIRSWVYIVTLAFVCVCTRSEDTSVTAGGLGVVFEYCAPDEPNASLMHFRYIRNIVNGIVEMSGFQGKTTSAEAFAWTSLVNCGFRVVHVATPFSYCNQTRSTIIQHIHTLQE